MADHLCCLYKKPTIADAATPCCMYYCMLADHACMLQVAATPIICCASDSENTGGIRMVPTAAYCCMDGYPRHDLTLENNTAKYLRLSHGRSITGADSLGVRHEILPGALR